MHAVCHTHTCEHVCARVHIHAHSTCTHHMWLTHMCVHTLTPVNTCACVCIHAHTAHVHVTHVANTHACEHTPVNTCVLMYASMHTSHAWVCTHTCEHIQACVYVCARPRMCTHITHVCIPYTYASPGASSCNRAPSPNCRGHSKDLRRRDPCASVTDEPLANPQVNLLCLGTANEHSLCPVGSIERACFLTSLPALPFQGESGVAPACTPSTPSSVFPAGCPLGP